MKRRSSLKIMNDLVVMVKPLIPVMCLAVLLGVTGYLCAVSLTIIAGYGIADVLTGRGISSGLYTVLIIAAVARGFLHYGEQYCNHYIAFRILALVRHKVFAVLRKLCPAKLEGRDKGNLISILTTDIELLEVFYAHTISPIMIALLVSLVMVIFQMRIHPVAGLWALSAYIVIGVIIPVYNGRRSAGAGMEFRNEFGELNSQVLGMLYGLDETIRYNDGARQNEKLEDRSRYLGTLQGKLNRFEASLNSVTGLLIQAFSLGMFLILSGIYRSGQIPLDSVLIGTVAMMGSFGPVVALANLSNTLSQTLASGERVLSLLEEEPVVKEVTGKQPVTFDGAEFENVTFAYSDDVILKDFSFVIPENRIIGIHGASGSGKSTLLKLLMRFWDIQKGSLRISDREIREINTSDLRNMESYITQETWLFNDTIAGNIAIGNIHATREEIIEAAKKASIHDFIEQLPEGYDTNVGELGDRLSGGERQRIGIARAFLHESDLLLMDEPTSNLDSLNEGIILKSLKESSENKTVVLVSHRKSTVSIADTVFEMDQGRVS